MANDELHKSQNAAANEQISSSILLLNNAIEQLEQEQSVQKEQALKLLDNAIEQITKEQMAQKTRALELLNNALKKLSQKQLSEKEKILKRLNNAIKKLSSVRDNQAQESNSILTRVYNFFRRPRLQQPEELPTPAVPHFFSDFSMQDGLSSNHNISDRQAFTGITIEIDLEDLEKDALYGIPLRIDLNEDTDTMTDLDTSTDTDTTQPIPTPAILHTIPNISSTTPLRPPIPDHNTHSQDNEGSTAQRDPLPPPIINTVLPATPIQPISHTPRRDHTPITTNQDIASSSIASNFLPPYLQRQMQQDKIGNKIINVNLIEYLHNKEQKKSTKFNSNFNNNQQLHETKYSTGENSQVSKFNQNAANIYKNAQVSNITTASQQSFEVSNNHDSKVKVSLVEQTNVSKLTIQSQGDNSTDLMLSITMETKKQLGPKANMKIYIAENTNEKYLQELIELLAKSISLGLTIQLLPPKNSSSPEQYNSIITFVINSARTTTPNIDPRLLPNAPSNRR